MEHQKYLPFTTEEFKSVFININQMIWPAQIFIYLAALAVIFILLIKGRWKNRIISAVLCAAWIGMGIVFFMGSFSKIEPNAKIFGILFIIQGAFFGLYGLLAGGLEFKLNKKKESLPSWGLFLYSILLYPLIGIAVGQRFPALPLLLMAPCPTVIFTFAIFLSSRRRLPVLLIIIPFFWSIVGLGAAINFDVPQDYGLFLSGIITLLVILKRNRNFKIRVIETNEGIQDRATVADYDCMQRNLRDKKWISTDEIIKNGIITGHVLELGSGPGYLGLEWLKKTKNTTLCALDISQEMLDIATTNAQEYEMLNRVEYKSGNVMAIPFDPESFDSVFSNGSLHEWEDPQKVLQEVYKVLKSGGRFFISDLKRNISPLVYGIFSSGTKGEKMKKGLASSIQAAYLPKELKIIFKDSSFSDFKIQSNPFGLNIIAVK